MKTNFAFLAYDWPNILDEAICAEKSAVPDPRASCFYTRRCLERIVKWMYRADSTLHMPYTDNLNALLNEQTFRNAVPDRVYYKADAIRGLGNQAVHSQKDIRPSDATRLLEELFHVCYWFARTYSKGEKPNSDLTFSLELLPKTGTEPPQSQAQIQKLSQKLVEKENKLSDVLAERDDFSEELRILREEIARIKAENAKVADNHNYKEAETRDFFVDHLLRESGWDPYGEDVREFPVKGMPNDSGLGKVDYVLWSNEGKPLAVVEVKRTKISAEKGLNQAREYADCLEAMYGQRPVIFTSNGYEHMIWDDAFYPSRRVSGFYKKPELEFLIQSRSSRMALSSTNIDEEIAGRPYQIRAIRRVAEEFDRKRRKVLLVMATGTGKTRTTVALCKFLQDCNWIRRVLFLADRKELVNQAASNFVKYLPSSSTINLVKSDDDGSSRICVSTYPTMMNLIDRSKGEEKRYSPGHFDLIVVDEAHRSVYRKYKAIFQYFDALLVGLTATPKDEIDRNTYSLFELEAGVPTDAYSIEEGVKEGYLVPSRCIDVPTKYLRQGIKYDDLSDEEKEEWDAIEWDEDGGRLDKVEAGELNEWLFNADTVDKLLKVLMEQGQKVSEGNKLGKTIIFAKNERHAEFIWERFDLSYPEFKGEFARIITHSTRDSESLISRFKEPNSLPQIAISVDMLDTGIDVPEILNLFFFKPVRSKTKYWQMYGRGTRTCLNLFGHGEDKKYFTIFDACQNFEYFKHTPDRADSLVQDSLARKNFRSRVELLSELKKSFVLPSVFDGLTRVGQEKEFHDFVEKTLQEQISKMNTNNFLVRPHRELVEKFCDSENWEEATEIDLAEITSKLSDLPTAYELGDENAQKFDFIILKSELAVLKGEHQKLDACRKQVQKIVSSLESKSNIPVIAQQMELIQDLATNEWWQDVTLQMLEKARLNIRNLVGFVDKSERKIVYTNFEDCLGEFTEVEFSGITLGVNFEKFKAKARHFLRSYEDQLALQRLKRNQKITAMDIDELEKILLESGIGSPEDIERAKVESESLGIFIRSLVGLDREAAQAPFSAFLAGKNMSSRQIEFISLIIEHLTEHGVLSTDRLYESPFTDVSPQGPEKLFKDDEMDSIFSVLEQFRVMAVGQS